jgi:hypothetical protein
VVVETYPSRMIISIYLASSQCNARIVLACSFAARRVLVELTSFYVYLKTCILAKVSVSSGI